MIEMNDVHNNQKYINFWNAYAYYNDLVEFFEKYALKVETDDGYSINVDDMFKRDYEKYEEQLVSYCRRSKMIKMATETCELLCKAILVEEGKDWSDMKGLGHNLKNLFNNLPSEKKNLIMEIDIDFFARIPTFYPIMIQACGTKYWDNDEQTKNYNKILDYIDSYSQGKILPNIKARYPGESLVDFNERFICAFVKLLYSLSYLYTNEDYYITSMSDNFKIENRLLR